MILKSIIRSTLIFFHLDLTKNLEYDRLTKIIIKQKLSSDSNCLDIGCHKGEILDMILRYSPNGEHFGFEPVPGFYQKLIKRFKDKATILPYALSNQNKQSTFHFVKNAPAYSGIKKRRYDIDNPDIEEIEVELRKLDDIIPSETRIDFVKIDVEGGEFDVLRGGQGLLIKNKPTILFESGLGASDFYGTEPSDLYNFINKEIGLKISLLKSYLKRGKSMELKEFEDCFNTNKEYYFIAHK